MLNDRYLDLLERQFELASSRCPPHRFEVAWADADHEQQGIIFCSMCGSTLSLNVPATIPVSVKAEGA